MLEPESQCATTTTIEDKPLDPAVERVRRKLVRFMAINLGLLFAALMAVVAAVVYKAGQTPAPARRTGTRSPRSRCRRARKMVGHGFSDGQLLDRRRARRRQPRHHRLRRRRQEDRRPLHGDREVSAAHGRRRIATVALVVADYDEADRLVHAKARLRAGRAMSISAAASAGSRWRQRAARARGCCSPRQRARTQRRASATRPAAASSCSWRPTIFGATTRRCWPKASHFARRRALEAYGTVAVFADLYGNLWDLIEVKG